MSIACPHRSISYSRWRLEVLNRLCASPDVRCAPILSFPHPQDHKHDASRARSYSSQKPPADSPYDVFGSLVKLKEQPVLHSGQKASTGEKEHAGSQEPRQPRLGGPRRKLDPYSQQSRQNVKDVIEALEGLVDRDEPRKKPGAVSHNMEKPWKHEPLRRSEVPQSPMFKKQRNRDRPFKHLQSTVEQPLMHDPWARMLAEPVRLCRGSGVRLPISLLSNWSLTQHPTNGEVYLLPSQLADVDKVEKVSRRQELRWMKNIRNLGAEDKHAPDEEANPLDKLANEANGAEPGHATTAAEEPPETDLDTASYQEIPSTSRQPGTTPAVRILPYDNLINLFSLTTLRHVSKRVNTTIRLLPRLWLDRFEQARHYERNREAFEKLTGEKGPGPPTVEATLDLNKLQWQTDIGERLLKILRTRIISAFKRTAMLNAQDKKRRLRHVSAIPISKVRGLLHLNGSISIHLHDHEDTTSHDLPFEDASSPDNVIKTHMKSPPDSVTDNAGVLVERALAPRFFLYLGPRSAPGLDDVVNPDHQAMIPPLLPSLVQGRAQRFPIFPIRAMLGEEFYTEMLELLEIHGHFQAEKLATLDTEGGDYLLMLKPSASNEFIEGLLRAVWRLWRYGGGRRWLAPENEDYEGWKAILSEMHRLQARHIGKGDVDAVAEGIEELVREVEEGAIEDHELEERAVEKGEQAVARRKSRINKQRE